MDSVKLTVLTMTRARRLTVLAIREACRLTSRKAFLEGIQVRGVSKQTWIQTQRSLTSEECLLLTERWVIDGLQSCGYVLVRLMGGEVLIEAQFLVHGRLINCRPS